MLNVSEVEMADRAHNVGESHLNTTKAIANLLGVTAPPTLDHGLQSTSKD
jgi:hypothetical protein